ncbi:hypothetical protein TWF281_001525 [Arthrobotrys megalospora]
MGDTRERTLNLNVRTKFTDSEWKQFEKQLSISEHAKKLAGQKHEIPPHLTKEKLILLLEGRELVDEGAEFFDSKYNSVEYYIEPYPPSYKSIEELESITIEDLHHETRHAGTKIFVKTVCLPKRLSTVSVIIEDENGVPAQLQIFNLGKKVDLDELLPVGQILCIKEPLFKFSTTSWPSLRVDHMGDLVFLEDDEGVPAVWKVEGIKRSAEDCKEIGNQAVRNGKLREGIKWYTKGLSILASKPEEPNAALKVALLTNRALVYIYLEYYELSLQDTEAALAIDLTNEKALYRKAKSLYSLRRYGKCGNTLNKLLAHHPDNQQARDDLAAVRQRLLEETRGEYDFAKLVKMAKNDFVGQEYDFADYTIPVCVKDSPISGKGLFTTRDVKMGDLLFVCKAFVNCRGSDNGISVVLDPETSSVYEGAEGFVVNALLEKLRRFPGALKEITKFHSASRKRRMDGQGDDVVDAFQIKDVCHNIIFSSCSYWNDFPDMVPKGEQSATKNHYKTAEQPFDPNAGIWMLPSYANHSCIPNSRRTFFGDMMVLRAVVNIPKNTEVLITYTDARLNYETRKQHFQVNWEFPCNCKLCEFESQPGISEALEEAMEKMRDVVIRVGNRKPTTEEASELKQLCLELESCYILPAHIVPRPFLGEHILRLTLFQVGSNPREAFGFLHAAPAAFGAVFEIPQNESGVIFRHKGWVDADLVRCYSWLANITGFVGGQVAADWRQVTKDAYTVVMGEDTTFDETFGERIWKFVKDEEKPAWVKGGGAKGGSLDGVELEGLSLEEGTAKEEA